MIPKPYAVHLELTNRCMLSCGKCPVNNGMRRPKQDMPFTLIKKIVAENPQLTVYGLNDWGEPLLHPQFTEIINYLKTENKRYVFATNAILLNDELATQMLTGTLAAIYFSVDAVGDLYSELHGYPYGKVEAKIKRFLALKNCFRPTLPVYIVATVSQQNESHIDALIKAWASYAAICLQPLLTFKPDDRTGLCNQLDGHHVVVLSNGVVVPCCADVEGGIVMGNAFSQTLTEIVDAALPSLNMDNPVCRCCSEYKSNVVQSRFKNG